MTDLTNTTSTRRARGSAIAAAALATFAACTASSTPADNQPDAAPAPTGGAGVQLATSASLGKYLADGDGKTLYYFAKDVPSAGATPATSSCGAACVAMWPPFHASSSDVGAGLNAGDFAEITRADGAKQTTYKGWPLYRFANDAAAGSTGGDGSGGSWFVLRDPFYAIMVMSSAATGAPKHYLVDSAGRSLYQFAKDTAGASPTSACSGACIGTWPAFDSAATAVPTGIDASVKSMNRADGKAQVSWKGHPLYYYSMDAAPGDIKGNGLGNGAWTLIDPTVP